MNIVILYERKTREIYNDLMLKVILESKGHSCEIAQMYEADKFTGYSGRPDIILAPHLYSTREIPRIWSRFGKCETIVNFQYEQILSLEQENEGIFDPVGEAMNAIHICWGEKTQKRLTKAGIKDKNLPILGAMQLDLLREGYIANANEMKKDYASQFGIDKEKKWLLFLSSFTYADAADAWVKMNENNVNASRENTRELHSLSRKEILSWFEKLLEETDDVEIIYRPHPDENFLASVNEISEKYANFHVINIDPVKNWINCCDLIYSWYSTSVIEAYYLNKKFSILRPIGISSESEISFLKEMNFIENEDAFLENVLGNSNILKESNNIDIIKSYYYVDSKETAVEKYANYIELLYRNSVKYKFNISAKEKYKAQFKTFGVKIVYGLYKKFKNKLDLDYYRKRLDNNYFIRWFIEMDNQIVQKEDLLDIEINIKNQLNVAK
ncbi:MAG: hypothetical protein N4A54_00650 [Peptostreptococcaceae bacterium]|jgi:surface carbohydrate biosynthesis protein|nr:hypothetical protein [Peptostreptococcaceae bacterium]